jgi:hypothetical protein
MSNDGFRHLGLNELNLLFFDRLRNQLNLPASRQSTRIVLTLDYAAPPRVEVTTRIGVGLRTETFAADQRIAPDSDNGNPCWCATETHTQVPLPDAPTQPSPPVAAGSAVDRLTLQPDDILLVTIPGSICETTAKRICEGIRRDIGEPTRRVLVVGDGVTFGVIGSDGTAAGPGATEALESIIARVMQRVGVASPSAIVGAYLGEAAAVRLRGQWDAGAGVVAPLSDAGPVQAFGRTLVGHDDYASVIGAMRDLPTGARIERRGNGWELVDAPPTAAKPAVIGIDRATGADMHAIHRLED